MAVVLSNPSGSGPRDPLDDLPVRCEESVGGLRQNGCLAGDVDDGFAVPVPESGLQDVVHRGLAVQVVQRRLVPLPYPDGLVPVVVQQYRVVAHRVQDRHQKKGGVLAIPLVETQGLAGGRPELMVSVQFLVGRVADGTLDEVQRGGDPQVVGVTLGLGEDVVGHLSHRRVFGIDEKDGNRNEHRGYTENVTLVVGWDLQFQSFQGIGRAVGRGALPHVDVPGIGDLLGVGQCLVRGDRYLERENGTEAGEGQQGEGGNRGYGSQGITP
ncbi:hypothetical protein SDC9_159876 [bioreactor metagenome]|uniref:Uncharacterized protein n=1 Tax=bioreactor metagenome TaxID=1076179 RepID=A0A645FDS9_9ZZZZ